MATTADIRQRARGKLNKHQQCAVTTVQVPQFEAVKYVDDVQWVPYDGSKYTSHHFTIDVGIPLNPLVLRNSL